MKIIGNENTLQQIRIATNSAKSGNRPVPHMLLAGAPGCGKTSTARHLAELTGANFIVLSCDSIKKREDLVPVRDALNEVGYDRKTGAIIETIMPSIIFIDEIHNLSLSGQELLGVMMEEWYIPVSGKTEIFVPRDMQFNPKISKIKFAKRWCPRFTLVGATTNDGKLSKPFRDRFKLRFNFSTYSFKESMDIVRTHAEDLKIKIEDVATEEIAKRGRGVPRILVKYLECCRDFAVVYNMDTINHNVTKLAFHTMGIDPNGLTRSDITILKALNEAKSPVGLDNIAIQLNEAPKVVSEAIEPFLIQAGFMLRAARGRTLTPKGKQYLVANGHVEIKEPRYYDIPVDVEYYD